jgi:hypothetical protein
MHSRGALDEIPHCVVAKQYEKLLILFIFMILKDNSMWLKNGHFNNSTGKSGFGRDLQQIIHKVIHSNCG